MKPARGVEDIAASAALIPVGEEARGCGRLREIEPKRRDENSSRIFLDERERARRFGGKHERARSRVEVDDAGIAHPEMHMPVPRHDGICALLRAGAPDLLNAHE